MTSITFRLSGQLPSGKTSGVKQGFTKTGKLYRYPNQRFKAWRTEALHALKVQLKGQRLPIVGPVTLLVDYVPGDKRRRDVPGILDCICHVLERSGILLDDSQVVNVSWNGFPAHQAGAGCTITLKTV